jgi:hypothetical protein
MLDLIHNLFFNSLLHLSFAMCIHQREHVRFMQHLQNSLFNTCRISHIVETFKSISIAQLGGPFWRSVSHAKPVVVSFPLFGYNRFGCELPDRPFAQSLLKLFPKSRNKVSCLTGTFAYFLSLANYS